MERFNLDEPVKRPYRAFAWGLAGFTAALCAGALVGGIDGSPQQRTLQPGETEQVVGRAGFNGTAFILKVKHCGGTALQAENVDDNGCVIEPLPVPDLETYHEHINDTPEHPGTVPAH